MFLCIDRASCVLRGWVVRDSVGGRLMWVVNWFRVLACLVGTVIIRGEVGLLRWLKIQLLNFGSVSVGVRCSVFLIGRLVVGVLNS